jgi:protein-S-isoprenylcysteine O-methyltransferase Ste14
VRERSATADAANVRVLPPAVPLLTILAGVVLNRVWHIAPGILIPAPERYWIGGAIALGALVGLGFWSVLLVRRSGQSENPYTTTSLIVQRGPFRLTRNPMYLQMVLICLGFAVMLSNVWILLLTPLCAWVLQRYVIAEEEAYLERKFGPAYLTYKGRVRRWI